MKGKEVTEPGSITVKFLRNPIDILRNKPFEWTLTLEVPGGGLVEINDPYPYEAPAEGYKSAITIGQELSSKTLPLLP